MIADTGRSRRHANERERPIGDLLKVCFQVIPSNHNDALPKCLHEVDPS